MKWIYRTLRALIVTALILVVVVPALLYVGLSLPPVQDGIRRRAESELSSLLGCDVTVGSLGIMPFNRIILRDVALANAPGDTIATIGRLGAGVDMYALLHGDITVNYTVLIDLDARIRRPEPGGPLNIQPILDALAPKDPDKPPTVFELRVNTVVLRRCAMSYDVLSEPQTPGRFNASHVAVSDLNADIILPEVTNEGVVADIKRLSCEERSGLTLSDMRCVATVNPHRLALRGFELEMPGSRVAIGDVGLNIKGWDGLRSALETQPLQFTLEPGSHIATADIAPLVPVLQGVDADVSVDADVYGTIDDIHLNSLNVRCPSPRLELSVTGHVADLTDRERVTATVSDINLSGNARQLTAVATGAGLAHAMVDNLSALGDFTLDGDAELSHAEGYVALQLSSSSGAADISAGYARHGAATAFEGRVQTDGIDVGALTGLHDIGAVAADINAEGTVGGGPLSVNAECYIESLTYRRHTYSGIEAVGSLSGKRLEGSLQVPDPAAGIDLTFVADLTPGSNELRADGAVRRLSPNTLGLTRGMAGLSVSCDIAAALEGADLRHLDGSLAITGLRVRDARRNTALDIDSIVVDTHNSTLPQLTTVTSDNLSARVSGTYDQATVAADVMQIVSNVFPALTGRDADPALMPVRPGGNNFDYTLTVNDTEPYVDFLRLPVSVIYPLTVTGRVSHDERLMTLDLDAPYLRQGNKLIEETTLKATLGGPSREASLRLSTIIPTKNGAMPLAVSCDGSTDFISARCNWKIQRPEAYEGDIGVDASFARTDGERDIRLVFRESQMAFNDTVWHLRPSSVDIRGRVIDVRDFSVGYDDRYARIDGRVSASPDDTLTLRLNRISLDYIFTTLALDNVQLGGEASGTFYASELLSGEPHLSTPGLTVDGISYNGTVFGDAVVRSGWDAATRGITLDADITGDDDCSATVRGAIYPLSESLDITFDAHHIPVGFMQYYMSAFTGDITGRASGRARLFGTFKYIDMEGDILAENLRMRVDFTNTYYTVTDSVVMRPGIIRVDRATLHDDNGNTAVMQGWVRHKFFKEPSFDFSITDANDFLAYNETERENPIWYGTVYGTGTAYVRGVPGQVDIGVSMRTCPNSTFTFVLSDAQEAGEYSFLRFRDRAALERPDTVDTDPTPALVRKLRSLVGNHDMSLPTNVSIDIDADITPDATIILVMDPVGGDRIRAVGSGNLRMLYSTNDELKMYGSYTLERGNYNFTLQDIIIKDFTIRDGSTINFRGDPYNADLDIKAAYSLNANLSDLDESFLQDKELNRTNVPVNAILLVDGSIQSPEVSFDLEFPTLTTDVYRKVRSIVSTEDMMNRQIIYLLALNRFYTPDYMASTTKGNELVSVASSTISSQLSSILGQLSDNWMIAPQFRSDRGDFSDVEVDLALSSTLLNNRLLFNGNFGYRDKSLNNTRFIGDFDLEYLLNRSGSLRLKAYNRYNDRNFYVKSATTTQGVGIMFKRDFDRMFNFLRPRRRDTVPSLPPDSIVPVVVPEVPGRDEAKETDVQK